ncbi:odorant receptor 131-2-like isoform X1 [Brienomyrus brachyistius]|uniref:odorant receptor 131-2-like isoform X1 n=1 Tax=Brienomyrus brachyistius TaxID=42636 RepID=UPI0020B406AC|nr:odorant receptor 131-2-like isoform X1 [Brienomyrus brachyistius]XP_048839992.1 odorant receptor 131-2-like isoform X1 [Brienomyrus brachyistius]
MADNMTGITNGSKSSDTVPPKRFMLDVIIIQVLVGIFLYINGLMIFTFFMKEAFRTDTRYILFAHMLFVDSSVMVTTNLAVLFMHYGVVIPFEVCIVLNLMMTWLDFCTPLTLVAMCLERYVAVCKPLRHAAISTPRIRVVGLLLIWGLGCVPALVIIFSCTASVSVKQLSMRVLCSMDALIVIEWQKYLQIAVFKFYFLLMSMVIAFTYVKVAAAARSASGDNSKSSAKAPRCLSPLIYGLRDQNFFQALKHYAVCGLDKKIQPDAPHLVPKTWH